MSHILLIGFMGAGKSTVGRLVAQRLELPFVDLDAQIEERYDATITEIFSETGEPGFRDIESRALESMVGAPDSVVACGGGVVVLEANRRLLSRLGTTILLDVDAATVIDRVGQSASRPLLSGGGRAVAERLLEEREPWYRAAADHVVDTHGKSVEQTADAIVQWLREERG
jgi:shikimate kinase